MAVTLSESLLFAIMPSVVARAAIFVRPLQLAMDRFEISATAERAAMFLAQIAHESDQLRWTCEIWGPTTPQAGYEGRADLGNTEPGDGERFKGRGLIQITGRANYEDCSRGLFGDDRLLERPELVEQPELACLSAAWWWQKHGLNEIADAGDFGRCTRRINGGMNGYGSRFQYWSRAKKVLGVTP